MSFYEVVPKYLASLRTPDKTGPNFLKSKIVLHPEFSVPLFVTFTFLFKSFQTDYGNNTNYNTMSFSLPYLPLQNGSA